MSERPQTTTIAIFFKGGFLCAPPSPSPLFFNNAINPKKQQTPTRYRLCLSCCNYEKEETTSRVYSPAASLAARALLTCVLRVGAHKRTVEATN